MRNLKTIAVVSALLLAGVSVQAQTWLEEQLNSQALTAPPAPAAANAYSEPFDVSWRHGNTGIGTSGWPLTKLNVHHNTNVDAQFAAVLTATGFVANSFTGIFTNGGTATVDPVGAIGYSSRDNVTGGRNIGIMGAAEGSNLGTGQITGVQGYASGNSNTTVTGANVVAVGNNNANLYGLFGKTIGSGQSAANIAVHGDAQPISDANSVNFGVEGEETFTPALDNVGVRGIACNASNFNAGVWGIGCATGSFAGYFDGDVTVMGTFSNPSDIRLKDNIKPLTSIMDQINRMKIYTYTFKSNTGINLPPAGRLQYGVIAQELEAIMPSLVQDQSVVVKSEDANNPYRTFKEIKTVNYQALIPVLIKGLQELSQKVDAIDKGKALETLNNLQQQLDLLSADNTNTTDAYLSAMPNPSSNTITIKYKYADCNNCTIVVTDLKGAVVKTIRNNTAEGETALFKSDFSSGVFLCNLVANGRVISSTKIAFID